MEIATRIRVYYVNSARIFFGGVSVRFGRCGRFNL